MRAKWLLPIFAVCVISCGGGGTAGSQAPQPQGAEFSFGTLVGRAASTNPPITTASTNVVATGLTGVITELRLRDQEVDPSEVRLLFSSPMQNSNGSLDVYSCNVDGSDLVRITNTPGISEQTPAASPDGKRIAFVAIGTGGDPEIFMMNADGSGRIELTSNAIGDEHPNWAPTGNNIVYGDALGDIYAVNVTTKSVTPIAVDTFANYNPSFSPDGTFVVFQSFNREADGEFHIYSTPSPGGGPVTAYHVQAGGSQTNPSLAPNGILLAYYDEGFGGLLYKPIKGASDAGPDTDRVAWSPDSHKVLYNQSDGTYIGMFVSNPDGSNPVEILSELKGNKLRPTYVPAPREVAFVGQGSLFGSRLTGMIFGQAGPAVRSLLGFDANTPSTAVLTKQTPDHSDIPNLVFSIDADVVREISYAHAPYWKPIKVVGSGTAVTAAAGALVSIDAVTGRIVAVLPFTGSRSSKPSFHDEGDTRVFTGSFLGAFDSKGENRGAAKEVRVNMQTGAISAG
jgi:Tol biopolymer transport system component